MLLLRTECAILCVLKFSLINGVIRGGGGSERLDIVILSR